MIDYLDIHKKKILNLETGIRCTLQCPDCNRTIRMGRGESIPGKDLTLEQFDKLSNFFKEIHFCGAWSDPIFNKHFIDMLKMCEDKKVDAFVHTAASHKPESWYVKAFEAGPNAKWRFGIDGLPKNSHRYRVNQDGEYLFKIMCLAKSMNINVEWQYLIFPFNEKTVNKAKKIAANQKIPLLLIDTPRNQNLKRKLARNKRK